MHIMKTSTLLAAAALGVSGNLFAQQASPVAPAASVAPVAAAPAVVAPAPAARPAPTVAPAPAVAAPAPAPVIPPPARERPPFDITVGVGVQAVQFDDDYTQDPYLYGATLSVSGYLSKARPGLKNVRWTVDAGFYFGDYTDTILNELGPYVDAHLEQRDVLTRKNDQFNLPVLATFAYELELGKHFNLRIGPSLGFTFVSIESRYEGYNLISNPNNPNDPNSNGKTNLVSLKKSGSEAVFTYGATIGATWNITDRLHADLQYRITGNEAVDLGFARDFGKSIIHQANLSIGWRF
jgi:hypothetical protein